ncbi:MAG TPA: response regulator transcription factor [Burkholderiaceae bacterium]|nr:response regulator transcription factor [Burkholderiaceae bacterium]
MRSAIRNVLIYGAIAALALSCLKLLALSPLLVDWGRELVAAVIALVGVVVGIVLRERGDSRRRSVNIAGHGLDDASPIGEVAAALLSPREREVLHLLAEGLSNKQMARRLNVSENTVKTHLANVYGKLGVNKRIEAVMAAQRLHRAGDHPKITRPGDGSDMPSSAIVSASTTLPRS